MVCRRRSRRGHGGGSILLLSHRTTKRRAGGATRGRQAGIRAERQVKSRCTTSVRGGGDVGIVGSPQSFTGSYPVGPERASNHIKRGRDFGWQALSPHPTGDTPVPPAARGVGRGRAARQRNHSRYSELSAKFRLWSGHARNIVASLWSGCSVATCRRQNRNLVEFLTACCQARLNGSNALTLLASEATRRLVDEAISRCWSPPVMKTPGGPALKFLERC
jgi:hypothetical protein